jgi:hypothetical protein
MSKLAKAIQFVGMVVTGVGLIYGVAQNDLSNEFFFLGCGVLIFMIGRLLDRK